MISDNTIHYHLFALINLFTVLKRYIFYFKTLIDDLLFYTYVTIRSIFVTQHLNNQILEMI